jgi:hypothetical protein
MEQCKGCYREEPGGCPVFAKKDRPNPCWAYQPDREQYIKEQRELMEYNNGRCEQAFKQAYKNIKRVTKGAVV